MRIIITKVGETERLELVNAISPSASKARFLKKQHIAMNKLQIKDAKKLMKQQKEPNRIRLIKQITVNQSKLAPEFIKERIDNELCQSLSKLKEDLLPKQPEESTLKLPFLHKTSSLPLFQPKQNFIKDIINHSAYNEMLIKLNKEINLNEKNYAMKQSDFRTKSNQLFQDTSHDILNTSIKSSEGEFFTYLKNKTDLTPLFLKKMASLNESKIIELNKICKIMKANQRDELIRKEKVEEMKKAKRRIIGVNLKASLDNMYRQVSSQNSIIKNYDKCLKSRKIDFAYLEKTQLYWKKYDADKLQRRLKSKSTIDDSLVEKDLLKSLSNNNNKNE